ncbi:MAG: transporter substrate-binding domain-containing protein [Trueperaceae bacterium]
MTPLHKVLIAVLIASLVAVLMLGRVLAQEPNLPPEWFPDRAPSVEGEAISFCVDARQPGYELHRALAQAIGDILLLEAILVDVDRTVTTEAEFEHLYVDLIDRCTAYMGFKLYPGAYPNWLIFTRPLYEARFVAITRPNGAERLEELPPGTPVGAVQGSMGDIRFLTFNNAQRASERRQRLPLGTPTLALAALSDGVVEALIIWEPWWAALEGSNPDYAEFRLLDAPIVSEPWIPMGAALAADRGAIQFLIDQALAELHADGTIAELLEEFGFPGRSTR